MMKDRATLICNSCTVLIFSACGKLQGVRIVSAMTRYMPVVFLELARQASVGLFTADDKTTIFPEYEHLRDRPECEGKSSDVHKPNTWPILMLWS